MYIVKQQQEYCLIRTICVITRKGPRTKLLMEISLVFSNIMINCSKRKHFLLCFILELKRIVNLLSGYPNPNSSRISYG